MFQKQKTQVNGTVDPKFENVRSVFQDNFVKGEEISAQLCVVHQGKIVGFCQSSYLKINCTSGGRSVGLSDWPKLHRRYSSDYLEFHQESGSSSNCYASGKVKENYYH